MKKLAVVVTAFAFAACGKSDETAPVVNVIAPSDNEVFSNGQTVTVTAEITDESGIRVVHLIVVDNNGIHLDHFEEHPDAKSYTLNRSFTVQSGKIYAVTVGATDHSDNTTNKVLQVSAN